MERLIKYLESNVRRLNAKYPDNELNFDALEKLYSVWPFNKFEYVISHLIAREIISLAEYIDMRDEYLARNKYLYIFEITSPRGFGEQWAQRHLNELVQSLERPTKKVDAKYSGQYDFWYKGIRIEVKASRAVNRDSNGKLVERALSVKSKLGFDMNFQQIKPACCDVFVWIGVWRDKIRYWVLSSDEVKNNAFFSKGQHRGNVGEGQLWLTEKNINAFSEFEVSPRKLLNSIRKKAIND